MNKKDLIKALAITNKASITETEEFFNNFEQVLVDAIVANQEVVLSPKVGRFILKKREAREGHNPQTGEKIQIPAKTAVVFKPSKTIKDKVAAVEVK
ncbi:HU family DNA-binding protein [Candidatus Phytoplasma solani]|uniref:DNA-binding protein HU n=1 Tax=Candidatus Phytoplasma solani TaxID=69896 RepID=A0A421NU92_9MOLU|nr:HU family DNA-binding protein [Candidatus Phytoplasma solani]RMI87598.1 DNA-binding protein HU [Candidatus Phytoplasma solani]